MKRMLKVISAIIVGIILNVAGRYIANTLNLPIWLDMTGTVIASYFGGLWGGIIAGASNNIISAFSNPTSGLYAFTSIVAAVIIHIFIKKKFMNNVLKAVISSFWLGIICTIVSTPLNIIFRSGYSGNVWGDTVVDMLKWNDYSVIVSALAGEAVVEIIDKQICVMLAFLTIYLIGRLRNPKRNSGKKAALLLSFVMLSACAVTPLGASAENMLSFSDNFVEKIYNNTNGMVSSEANVICETDDGYIWIGSYAGLTRYDGNEFEFVREGGLVNVVGMMTDSKGRLWIGTNDKGIARYQNGKFTYFTVKDGLPSNSVRCFAEDNNGNVYVGTSDKLCKFSADDEIEISEQNITFVKSMVVYKDMLVTLDNAGEICALDGERKLTINSDDKGDYFGYSLALTSHGLMIGTESGELFSADIEGGKIVLKEQIDISANQISAIFEDSRNRIWVGTESGFGYIGQDGTYRKMSYEGFDSSIDYFHEDYQGNIWVASSRYGVMKLSESSFINAFERIGVENQVVNAITRYKGNFFGGTDKGLVVFSSEGISDEFSELTELTNGYRIRSIFPDSKGGLWLCTYSGLVHYSSDGKLRSFTTETDGVTSDRFRCITELSDGTLVAGTADGINFFKDETLVKTLTEEDGLANTQILSVVETDDGTVWAGSDGSGIYVISDGKLVGSYTVDDGLTSNVILRIVPVNDSYLVVTSNALCCIDSDGTIRKLGNFPYFNNYDVIIRGETAFITCSAGMYKMNINDLCENKCSQYRLYSASEGLFSGFTANSWNYVSDDGLIYLCSNNGVIIFNGNDDITEATMKFGIISVECDGKSIGAPEENVFSVPGNAKDLSFYASVRNYAFSDAKVRFFIKELDNNPKTYRWNEIEPIKILKPDFGKYTICLQLLDSSGEYVLQEAVYIVKTEPRAWQTPKFRTYLIVVCSEIILITLISVISMIIFVIRKNELEKLQHKLEQRISEQTSELVDQQKTIKKLFIQTVTALSEAVDAKDRYTSGHSKRVAEYSRMIAVRMGKSKEEQEEIYRAGLLHDVGKIRIPVEIINKESKLTEEEFNIIKIHPVTGYHILRGISGSNLIALVAKHHHERYDGNGYPNGLVGEKIPEAARILCVADAYDAMTSNRSYREALSQDVVRNEIENCKGTQFDPKIADIMLEMIDEDKDYTMRQEDSFKRRILIVDDDETDNKTITQIMHDEPMYEIVSVSSGEEALETLEKQAFNLILLDANLPDMDGLEAFKLIREKYQMPVVLLTSNKTFDMSMGFAELGCDDYITKPFLPLLIKEVVHNMTERMNMEE